eukprot:TRINITY_DN21291_c0_g1_i1.p1 TRINITY_DN21291_c0_g1~~TRINITY_DN21291_c0_g1_i1.p1  ORF type:complete len:505 (-),score=111.91 TRINITY_DN21291_c0_g1_i1:10-1524(-)
MALALQGVFFGIAVPTACILVCCALLAVVSDPGSLLTSCVAMACATAATHMLLHRWQDSPNRYQVLVILSMPAVYATLVGLQQVLPPQALYLSVCAEIYEGLGLVTFLLLLRSLADDGAGSAAQQTSVSAFGAMPYECMAATLPIYKIAFLLVSTVDSRQHLGLGSLLSRFDLFCSFFLGCLALLAIGRLLARVTEELEGSAMSLKQKFWAVKGMVTVMFNQSLLLWLLDHPLQELLALLDLHAREDFEATLVALEMFLLSLWHTVAFPIKGDELDTKGSSSRDGAFQGQGDNDGGAWLWPWTVAQMTILASCLFVRDISRMYHVWFVLACALCILVAFACRCLRPARRLVVVAAVVYLFLVYLLALGQHQGVAQCAADVAPLSAGGLAQSAANCTEHLMRGECPELWLQHFCCLSCGAETCPHCGADAPSLARERERQVRIGACMACTASVLAILVRAGYSVLDCGDGRRRVQKSGPACAATEEGSEAYRELESDMELSAVAG